MGKYITRRDKSHTSWALLTRLCATFSLITKTSEDIDLQCWHNMRPSHPLNYTLRTRPHMQWRSATPGIFLCQDTARAPGVLPSLYQARGSQSPSTGAGVLGWTWKRVLPVPLWSPGVVLSGKLLRSYLFLRIPRAEREIVLKRKCEIKTGVMKIRAMFIVSLIFLHRLS